MELIRDRVHHCTDEQPESQRRQGTCLRPHSMVVTELSPWCSAPSSALSCTQWHEKETHQESGDGGGVDGCPEPACEELAGTPCSLSWAVSNLCGREGANIAHLSRFSLSCFVLSPSPFLDSLLPLSTLPPSPACFQQWPCLDSDYPGKSFPSLGLSFLIYYMYGGLNQWLPNLVLPSLGGSFKNSESWAFL